MLEHLDQQLRDLRYEQDLPSLPEWDRVASTIYREIRELDDGRAGQLRNEMLIPPEWYVEEMTAFQAWMDIAHRNSDNPVVVRAQVMTQLYVSFVWLRDSVLDPASRAVDQAGILALIVNYLRTDRRRQLRNAVAHGRWCYLQNYSGLEYWDGQQLTRYEVSQREIDTWQTLSRGTSIAVLLALTDSI